MTTVVCIQSGWTSDIALDGALMRAGYTRNDGPSEIIFQISNGARMWIDGIVAFLSMINEISKAGVRVTLIFEQPSKLYGYLNRLGFFSNLLDQINVHPERPLFKSDEHFKGNNSDLIEIEAIRLGVHDKNLPDRLASGIHTICSARHDVKELSSASSNVLSELISNVHEHSETPVDGYVSLQAYRRANSLKLYVSDSGVGLVNTLRPTAGGRASECRDLLLEVFRNGLSRRADGGCGLMASARKAIRFRAELNVRVARQRVVLKPGLNQYEPSLAECYDNLPHIEGTHIGFTFPMST